MSPYFTATKIKNLKEQAIAAMDVHKAKLTEISMEIHDHPELCFQEFRASKLLADYLKANDFKVEYPAYGLDTAFTATIGSGKPKIAILAEYDAVADIGHACGHNVIGTSAIGAGVSLASVIDKLGGTVVIIGTPAEEGGNGKEIMIKRGAFADIDAAMMIHPTSGESKVHFESPAFIVLKTEYFGKVAHPSEPALGINAQDAMMIAFVAFNALRIATPFPPAIDGTITKAGVEQHTLIPDHTVANLHVRARTDADLKNRLEKILNCFKAGALATGARLEYQYDWEMRYRGLHPNRVMGNLFDANMKLVNPNWNPAPTLPGEIDGATDMGNVGTVVPGIHPWIAIAPAEVAWHSPAATKATATAEAHKGMSNCAKAMAMTTIDLIAKPELLNKARAEFEKQEK